MLTIWNVLSTDVDLGYLVIYNEWNPFHLFEKINDIKYKNRPDRFKFRKYLEYKKFDRKNFMNLQMLVKLLYMKRWNRMIWSPSNLGGKCTKIELWNLFECKPDSLFRGC